MSREGDYGTLNYQGRDNVSINGHLSQNKPGRVYDARSDQVSGM